MIIRNSARCKLCKDEIVSIHRHDFAMCSCGAIGIDGGVDYIRRIGNPEHFEDTSIYDDIK